MQIAREGAGTDAAHLRSFSPERRFATLVATVLDTATILIDETLEMHERFLGKLFNKGERKHLASFQEQGKAINGKVRLYALIGQALIETKQSAAVPFSEIEKLMTWEAFKTSVAEASKLARPEEFDHLALLTQSYPQLRRYAPQLLECFGDPEKTHNEMNETLCEESPQRLQHCGREESPRSTSKGMAASLSRHPSLTGGSRKTAEFARKHNRPLPPYSSRGERPCQEAAGSCGGKGDQGTERWRAEGEREAGVGGVCRRGFGGSL